MKLIICIDDRGGMMFNKRRVSRDRLLVANLAELVGDAALYAEPYSAEIFAEAELNLICSAQPMSSADEGDYAFVETFSPAPMLARVRELIIYKWNRRYPYDVSMGFTPEAEGFRLKESSEFPGSSHDKITREIYTR